jgi:hypothetical protein
MVGDGNKEKIMYDGFGQASDQRGGTTAMYHVTYSQLDASSCNPEGLCRSGSTLPVHQTRVAEA